MSGEGGKGRIALQHDGEEREIVCSACNGDGSFEPAPSATPYGPHYGSDMECMACGGTGYETVKMEPATMEEDDL